MVTPNEKLANSLTQLRTLQQGGRRVFESKDISRVHRERLLRSGFLQQVIQGWLITKGPDVKTGDTTPWYASFWEFCARYCERRFGENWHLSPEQSLLLHGENNIIPTQVIVYSPRGTNNTRPLLFGTSIYDLKERKKEGPSPSDITIKDGLRLFSPAAALMRVPEAFFVRCPTEAQIALTTIRDASELLARLLDGGHSAIAARLAGAFRRIERPALADDIVSTMKAAGYDIRETDPFSPKQPLATLKPGIAPVVGRIQALWNSARERAISRAPATPGLPTDRVGYLKFVDEIYTSDAYHSLSIEGYTVSPELIERVRTGNWDPQTNKADRESLNALAARGYWEAFRVVRGSVAQLLGGAPAGQLVRDAYRSWFRALFRPAVQVGHLAPSALAGYRNHPIYIRGSRHVPPRWESVPDAMDALFDLMEREPDPFVRAVLGHWLVGYIHPFFDGNGRMARFIMNAMLASGGYPWSVIRIEDRPAYMEALEEASVGGDIRPFAGFVADRIQGSLAMTLKTASAPQRRGRIAKGASPTKIVTPSRSKSRRA
ncbi:MAG TPA: Fic family protein [Hyphomicrobiaceae bacterium]|nr:Fic family protein [Hyphomicrobiaceae bacterium]